MEIAIALFALGGLAALACAALVAGVITRTKDPWKMREERRRR